MTQDNLDKAVLACITERGAASVGQIARELNRAYSTVLLRCLKMQAAGLLKSSWEDCTRLFIAN